MDKVIKVVSENVGAFSHHYPAPAVIVTAQAEGRSNAMAVAWHCSISLRPPLYGISLASRRFTYELIAASKEFAINFMPLEAAELVAAVGGSQGRETDKFKKFNIAQEKPLKVAAPILVAAYATYECKLVDDRSYGDHRWLVGEVVAVHRQEKAFRADDVLDVRQTSPALYLGRDHYATTDRDRVRSLPRSVYSQG